MGFPRTFNKECTFTFHDCDLNLVFSFHYIIEFITLSSFSSSLSIIIFSEFSKIGIGIPCYSSFFFSALHCQFPISSICLSLPSLLNYLFDTIPHLLHYNFIFIFLSTYLILFSSNYILWLSLSPLDSSSLFSFLILPLFLVLSRKSLALNGLEQRRAAKQVCNLIPETIG